MADPRVPGSPDDEWYTDDPETGVADEYPDMVVGNDPETGAPYSYRLKDETKGGSFKRRRKRKFNDKQYQKAVERARNLYYGQVGHDNLLGISEAWSGMEENMPSELDLLGGREWQDSDLANAAADAEAIESQKAALAALENIARGGYSPEEAAAMQRMRMETAQQEQAQRQALQQQFAARGMAGGGAEIAAQLAAQQGGANRANEMTLETQAQAQRRALQALAAQGDLSSGIRGQSFEEDATRRSAVDDFNRWNLERRGGAAQQGYDNRFGLAQAQSQAAAATSDRAYQERQRRIANKREKQQMTQDAVLGGADAVASIYG